MVFSIDLVGRILTQKILRQRSVCFTRVRNHHFIQHDRPLSHSTMQAIAHSTWITSSSFTKAKEHSALTHEASFGSTSQVHSAWKLHSAARAMSIRHDQPLSIRHSRSMSRRIPPPDHTIAEPPSHHISTEPPQHLHAELPNTGPSLHIHATPNEPRRTNTVASPDRFSPGPPAVIYFQDPCPLPHSINRGAGVQQWQTSLRAQARKELSNYFHTLVYNALYL